MLMVSLRSNILRMGGTVGTLYMKCIIWQVRKMAHSVAKRIQLTWYWPGMVAEIRCAIKTCEICQMTKAGGNKAAVGRKQMYAGRPWKKVAVDLV